MNVLVVHSKMSQAIDFQAPSGLVSLTWRGLESSSLWAGQGLRSDFCCATVDGKAMRCLRCSGGCAIPGFMAVRLGLVRR